METSINLLPQELRVKYPVLKLKKKFGKILIFEAVLLGFVVAITAGALLILGNQVQKVSDKKVATKQSIGSLEQTEQRLFLVKDRISKTSKVLGENSVKSNLNIIQEMLKKVPEEAKFVSAQLDDEGVGIKFLVQNSSTATRLFDVLVDEDFGTVAVNSFVKSEEGGYLLAISLK